MAGYAKERAANAIPGFGTRDDCKGLAIVTGAGSGIGLGLAVRAARCGMTLLALDLSFKNFPEIEAHLVAAGAAAALALPCDVSSPEALAKAAAEAQRRLPSLPVSLVCANAGYGGPPLLAGGTKEIQRQLDVILSGVVWTFKAFQERFLAQREPCALVATSSLAGCVPASGSYGVGKHGCVAVMEALHAELAMSGKRHVTTHCLMPGAVSTGIVDAVAKNDLAQLRGSERLARAGQIAFAEILQERGMSKEYSADVVFEAIETGCFYILLEHPEEAFSFDGPAQVAERHRRLEAGAPPSPTNLWKAPITEQIMARAAKLLAVEEPPAARL